MIDTGLNGKTVIVTGANHGIGAATAIAFVREGASVLVTYLRQSPELYGETQANVEQASVPGRAYYCRKIGQSAEYVVNEIRDLDGECMAWEADLSNPNTIPKLFDKAEERWGAVDVISPGAVQTGWIPAELEKEIAAAYPLRRIGKPEDIAKAVIFFASNQAEWITGQVLQVGGGNRM